MKHALQRRGFNLGIIESDDFTNQDPVANWKQGRPLLLQGMFSAMLQQHRSNIAQSDSFYRAILDQQDVATILSQQPYPGRLQSHFESLGSLINEGEDQEIETVFFDAIVEGQVVAEDLWMKTSWLSFYEQDASLRFRFSFGEDHAEDVAADPVRQRHAAQLTDAIFPESRLITDNPELLEKLQQCTGSDSFRFVERIIYFNAPQGGAYLHHDRERGHAGVVYAQLSGTTVWLALAKHQLLHEIALFLVGREADSEWPESIDREMQSELLRVAADAECLSAELESFSNGALIHLLNETAAFVQQLVGNGHGRLLRSGDVLLLPQQSDLNCCWHSVFCLDGAGGQALSFAIRAD